MRDMVLLKNRRTPVKNAKNILKNRRNFDGTFNLMNKGNKNFLDFSLKK